MDYTYSPWISPGQNTGVGSSSLLQGVFPTQGSNPGLLHCRRILYQLSHKGSPRILEWVAYPFSRGSSHPRNRTKVSCETLCWWEWSWGWDGGTYTHTGTERKRHTDNSNEATGRYTALSVMKMLKGTSFCKVTGESFIEDRPLSGGPWWDFNWWQAGWKDAWHSRQRICSWAKMSRSEHQVMAGSDG